MSVIQSYVNIDVQYRRQSVALLKLPYKNTKPLTAHFIWLHRFQQKTSFQKFYNARQEETTGTAKICAKRNM